MFEVNGKEYELKFNLKRIDLIEKVMGKPLFGIFIQSQGALSIGEIENIFSYALKEKGSDSFVAPKEGAKHAEYLIQENGLPRVTAAILETLQEDCPFFFQAD